MSRINKYYDGYQSSFENWQSFSVGKWITRENYKQGINYFCRYNENRVFAVGSMLTLNGLTILTDISVRSKEGGINFNIEDFWVFMNGRFDVSNVKDCVSRKEDLISLMRKYKKIFYGLDDLLVRVSLAEAYDLAYEKNP